MAQTDPAGKDPKLRWEQRRFFIGALGGTILFIIGLWQFSITSRNDFARPVLERQIALCIEAADKAARLAYQKGAGVAQYASGQDAQDFLALYFGKLGVVEDRCLYQSMVAFHRSVFEGQAAQMSDSRLALRIAFACRRMISKNWSAGLVSLYDPQNLLEDFTDLADYQQTMSAAPGCD